MQTSFQRLLSVALLESNRPCCRHAFKKRVQFMSTSAEVAAETKNEVRNSGRSQEKSPKESKFSHPPPGQFKAYDESVKLIQEDSRLKLQTIASLEKKLETEKDEKTLSSIKREIQYLQVQAYVNDPQVRWNFEHGHADLTQPAYRYLRQQQWKKGGRFDILHQRYTQMYITPDVLPTIDPSVDMQIAFGNDQSVLEPGSFIEPEITLQPPRIDVTTFTGEMQSYSLILVDPDVPDEVNQTYITKCHWLKTDIPIGLLSSDLSEGKTIYPYTPSHPHKGTKYHRYTLLLLRQPNPSLELTKDYATQFSSSQKLPTEINVRDFIETHDLEPVAINFWRAVWNEHVSKMYQDGIIAGEEPIYGLPEVIRSAYVDTEGRKYENL